MNNHNVSEKNYPMGYAPPQSSMPQQPVPQPVRPVYQQQVRPQQPVMQQPVPQPVRPVSAACLQTSADGSSHSAIHGAGS